MVLIMLISGACTQMTSLEKDIENANHLFKKDKFSEAEEVYTKIIRGSYRYDSPAQEASVYINRGNAFQRMKRSGDALSDYNRAIEIDPSLGEAYANRGILYDHQDQHEEAIADYKTALELNEKLGEPPGIIARVLYDPPDLQTIMDRLEFLEDFLEAHEKGLEDVQAIKGN